MASINVSKGLFRLWVIVAVCWILALTVIKFDEITAMRVGYYDPKLADQISDPYDNSPSQQEIKNAKICKQAKSTADIWLFCDPHPQLGSKEITIPLWSKRIKAAGWIFLPPLTLLLLGFGLLWAVRGFRE